MKQKVIIDIYGVEPALAVLAVTKVIEDGRVSEARGIKHYCWITKFAGITVYTRDKKTKTSADSFIVLPN